MRHVHIRHLSMANDNVDSSHVFGPPPNTSLHPTTTEEALLKATALEHIGFCRQYVAERKRDALRPSWKPSRDATNEKRSEIGYNLFAASSNTKRSIHRVTSTNAPSNPLGKKTRALRGSHCISKPRLAPQRGCAQHDKWQARA
jgi:hypothetical protein